MTAPPPSLRCPHRPCAASGVRVRSTRGHRRLPTAARRAGAPARRCREMPPGPDRAGLPAAFACSARRIFSGVTGNLIDAHADGVVDRVGHRRHDRQQRSLPDFLRAERTLRIGMLDQVGEDLRHVQAGRALVLEHRRELVHQRVRQARRQPAERLLFHQALRRGPCRRCLRPARARASG